MSKKNETAGETAKSNVKSFTLNDITYTDGEDRVTIKITGQAFANLKEITEITNRHTEDDYTPSCLLRNFCLTEPFLLLNKKNPDINLYVQTLAGEIVSFFTDDDELRSQFESAGFNTSF